MTIAAKLVTAEELLDMPDHKWLELYEGELRNVSPANARHGNIAVQIAMLLNQFVKPRKLGYILVEGGFVLRRRPDTVLGPDVSFIQLDRAPNGLPEKFFEGHPDLAVEVISPRNPRPELLEKMRQYMKLGTPLGWLVDPNPQTVEVFRPNAAVEKLTATDTIAGESIIPGFSCRAGEFFE